MLKLLNFRAAHSHAGPHVAALHALVPVHLLVGAVFEGGPADLGLAVLVGVQHVHQLLVVRLVLRLDCF